MTGLWVLLLLILIAALPVVPAYLWVKHQVASMSFLWFLLSLLTGVISLLLAGILQTIFFSLFPFFLNYHQVLGEPNNGIQFFTTFIQIALTEEAGRLGSLGLFFRLGAYFKKIPLPDQETSCIPVSFGAATGLIAGLGFGIIETASYGAANINIAVLRAFTATPLHGACGARVGMGIVMFRETPVRGLGRFLSAVAIHGMYNVMVVSPGIPQVFPILIVAVTLIASIQSIRPAQGLDKTNT
ncbi:MAG: PrsW family intramembrane metalloprotease [Treponema sp.]|jgi:RsiW-degrading membrane proteinase PrsW (M82 family)|nr:PrsW family intramembrane metalloprotease [Treponema sp.]